MNDRSSKKPKKGHDFAVNAFRVMQEATDETTDEATSQPPEMTREQRSAAEKADGRRGDLKGGKARAEKPLRQNSGKR